LSESSIRRLAWQVLAGPLLWAAYFGFVYAVQHVACTRLAPAAATALVDGVLIAATLATLLAMGWMAWCPPASAAGPLLHSLCLSLLGLSAVAVVWTAISIVLPTCATLR